jgi:hypothetical protein
VRERERERERENMDILSLVFNKICNINILTGEKAESLIDETFIKNNSMQQCQF